MINKRILQIFLAIVDFALLLLSLLIVLYARIDSSDIQLFSIHFNIFFLVFLFWILVFYLFDLYNIDITLQITKLFFALLVCALGSILLFYLFPRYTLIAPKTNLVLIVVLFTIFHYIWRSLFEYLYTHFFHGHEIMVGVSDIVSLELVEKLQKKKIASYKILGVITTEKYYDAVSKLIEKEKIFTSTKKFEKAVINSPQLKSIVVTEYWAVNLSGILYNIFHQLVSIINVINFFEYVFHYIPIHSADQYWVMNNINIMSRKTYLLFKRLVDIILVLVLILPFSFVMLLVALLIKIYGGSGPVFFKQERLGQHCKPFTVYKFRTMVDGIEEKKKELFKNKNITNARDIDNYFKELTTQTNDVRVTRLGKFLRSWRLDEIPQIINVLLGQMSFIGPRPEQAGSLDFLAKQMPHFRLRSLIKPGLSGWAQVNYSYGSSLEDFKRKLCYDIFYVKNINMVLDIQIALKTIGTLLQGNGQ